MDLLDCSALNIKFKYGLRKVKIFHGVGKNVVDRAEEQPLIHADTSRSPLLNEVLSRGIMCSCELLRYLARSGLTWLLTPLLAKLVFVQRGFELKPAVNFS